MLPQITYPTFPFTIPTTGHTVTFRMMSGYEEEKLLIAKESDDPADVFPTIS
jgi:hypothetical protein